MKKFILFLFLVFIIVACNRDPLKKEMIMIDTISKQMDSITLAKPKIFFDSSNADSLNYRLTKLKVNMDSSTHSNFISTLINQEEKKIGEINHIIKDTMKYQTIDTVEMTISYNCPKELIVDQVKTFKKYKVISNKKNIKTQNIKITPQMRARLIDPSGESFVIIPITDTVQIVEMKDSTYTLWQWRVRPIKYGENSLVINVDMIMGGHKKSIHIYQDSVHVYIGFWSKTWMFIQTYWEYLTFVLTGIFAIIGWIWQKEILGFFRGIFKKRR